MSNRRKQLPTGISPVRRGVTWLLLLAVSAVCFAFRLGREPLWLDESYSFAITQHDIVDLLPLVATDVHPPLYYVILKLTQSVFGSSPLALRIPSVIAALGLVALGAGPVRRIWNDRTAFLYSLLVLMSPGILCFAQEARMYTFTAFFVTGAVLYGQLVLTSTRRSDRLWFGIFTCAAGLTHYFGLVAVGINGLLLLLSARANHQARFKPLMISLVGAALLYSPWLIPFSSQLSAVTKAFWIPPMSWNLLSFTLAAPFTYKFEDVPLPWQALVAFGLVVVLTSFTLFVKRDRESSQTQAALQHLVGVFLLTLGFGLIFSWIFRPILMPRYMISCGGLLLLAAAIAISNLRHRYAQLILATALIGLSLPAWLRIQTSIFNGPFHKIAQHLRNSGDNSPTLLHVDGQTYYPSWHAIQNGRHVMITGKGAGFEPSGSGVFDSKRLEASEDLATVLASRDRVWLVDMSPTGFGSAVPPIADHKLWQQRGPVLDLSLPMSWVKVNLIQFEKRTTGHDAQ